MFWVLRGGERFSHYLIRCFGCIGCHTVAAGYGNKSSKHEDEWVLEREDNEMTQCAGYSVVFGGVLLVMMGQTEAAEGPAFACDKMEKGSIAALVCQDAGLSALDRQLASVYAAASKRAVNEQPPTLKAEQRGWIKGRDECWKSEDKHTCVAESYQQHIVELQARYRLVESIGPVTWQCDGNPHNEVITTFFKTNPGTLIAERGDQSALMTQQPSGSGTRYAGRNESYWEHQGEATIVWGYGAPELHCKKSAE